MAADTQALQTVNARIQANNTVPTQTAAAANALPSTYYNGSTLFAAAQSTPDRLADLTQRTQDRTAQLQTITNNRVAAAQASKDAAEAKAQEAAARAQVAAAKQKYSITVGGVQTYTGTQSNFSYGTGLSSSYKVTGGAGNTSGAANAIGGVVGSGTYKYVYNNNLSAARNKVLGLATSYLGTKYVLGGESHSGIDCSGLVQLVYSQMGFKVPTHSAADQGQTGGRNNGNGIPGVKVAWGSSALQPGDIIAWKDGSHIAIYAGNGRIIEAANPTRGTEERPLWANPNDVVGIHLNFPTEKSAAQSQDAALASRSR